MNILWRRTLGAGAAGLALLGAGCDTARPGAGFTNGPSPSTLRDEDKPAMRTDLPEPPTPAGDAALAPVAPENNGATGGNAGTGGRNNDANQAAPSSGAPESPSGKPPRTETPAEPPGSK